MLIFIMLRSLIAEPKPHKSVWPRTIHHLMNIQRLPMTVFEAACAEQILLLS